MINKSTFDKYARSPVAFRSDLIVDVDGVARRFGDVQDDWQKADFAALDPALMRCNGRSKAPTQMRGWFERSRGHSKTSDLAFTCVYALAFATRPLRGYCYAADKGQANLLRDAMQTVIRLNPWLGSILTVEAHRVVNSAKGHPGHGGTLTIEASDVASSFGILPDLIIADELTHWQGDGSLWHSLISSAAKRSNCLMVVISNAGFCDSWQHAVREAARADEAWIFSRLDGPQASWLSQKTLAEQKRMLPAVAYARLWLNQWASGGGDALTPADINAAFIDGLEPMTGTEPDFNFVAGVDLGLTRDGSAIVVLGVPQGETAGRIRLAYHKLWRPIHGKKIDLIEVERHLLELDERFNLECVGFDPWQAESMAQRLEVWSEHKRRSERKCYHDDKPWMQEVPPSATNLRDQCTLVIEAFADRRLKLFPCEPLRVDLLKLRAEEKSYGIRLTSPRDGEGHGDSYSAFALALLKAHEIAGAKPSVVGSMFSSGGGSALSRALREHEERAAEYKKEMEMLERGGDNSDGSEEWEEVMRFVGRL